MPAIEHRAAVCKALNAFLEDRFPKVDSIPASARRRRVQAAEGEILTSEESLARLLEEEKARALAPKRRVGRPKGSVKSGPIDKFVSKPPPKKKSGKSPTQEKSGNHLPTQEKSVNPLTIQDNIYTPHPPPYYLNLTLMTLTTVLLPLRQSLLLRGGASELRRGYILTLMMTPLMMTPPMMMTPPIMTPPPKLTLS